MEFKIGDVVDIPEGRGTVIVHTCTSKDMTLVVKSKLPQASTSLQDAYKAWVKKLSDEMEKTFSDRVEEDDVNNILYNLFKITQREQKSFDEFHS